MQARLQEAAQLAQNALGAGRENWVVSAVLMTHRDVIEASVQPELLAQLSPQPKVEIVGGDGAYGSKVVRAAVAECSALALTPPVDGVIHWPTRPGRQNATRPLTTSPKAATTAAAWWGT